MKPVIPTKIEENATLHMEFFDTDTDFQVIFAYLKGGKLYKEGTPYKVFVWDTINCKAIERHYLKTTDECREKVSELINGYIL